MKRVVLSFVIFFTFVSSALAAPFSPTVLTLSAPPVVQYNFDGSDLSLPVSVSGTPANVTFLVFTNGQAAAIRKVKNGYLGWHYVNKIDTCVYYSDPLQLSVGSGTLVWDGRDQDKNAVPPGEYTYYLLGYDDKNVKVNASQFIQTRPHDAFLRFQEKDIDGKPLANPIVYNSRYFQKWILGGDPEDDALVETTKVTLPSVYTGQGMFPILDPTDFNYFFIEAGNTDTNTQAIVKYKWIPNGQAMLETSWAQNGVKQISAKWGGGNADAGVEADTNYLYTVTGNHFISEAEADLRVWNINDGTLIKKFDITPWWSNTGDMNVGGQLNGGPNTLYMRDGWLFLNCHCSCLKQVVNPVLGLEDETDLIVWSNGNGDYTFDRNFEETAEKKWICNDYNVGPYTYTLQSDANQFSIAPCYDMGAVSFGLLAPDGTGLGYRAFAGETSGLKYGQYMVDNGSAFDGLYSDNNNGSSGNVGIWFTGQDSFKGVITSTGKYLFITSPGGGEVWGTGTPHTISWISSGVSAVRIEYSIDNGSSWALIADEVSAASYSWTPEGIQSDKCLVRVTSTSDSSLRGVSRAPFTITPPYVKVSAPNGGEVLESGVTKTISWTFLGIENVNIEFSSDNGSTWTQIASGIAASQKSYTWKVPESVSEHCLVRVSDAVNASISDESDATFQIKASFIQITTPNGGEEWEAGQTVQITWVASGSVTSVRIEFSSDNGASWNTIADAVASSGGSYSWKVPNTTTPRCLVRVSDAGNTGLMDRSDGVFTVIPSTSQWTVYTTADGLGGNHIWSVYADPRGGVWAATDNGASFFNGLSWTTYTTSNSGLPSNNTYDVAVDFDNVVWFVPTWDRVTSFDGLTWKTHQSGPSSGRYMVVDQDNVKWIGTFGSGVARYDGSTWKYFDPSNSGVKAYECQIPAVDLDNTIWFAYGYSHGITHFDGTTWKTYTTSDGLASDFTRGVAIGPDGVKWFGTVGGVSRFDGTTWKKYTTADGLVNNGVEELAVDHDNVLWVGTEGGVSSFDGIEWKSYNTSNSPLPHNHIYKIAVDINNVKWFATGGGGVASLTTYSGPYVRVSSPNGGELWESGSTHEITWVSKDVERISIEYSIDNGSTWNVLSGNVDATLKSYIWTLPQTKSASCKVRLTDVSNASHVDASNGIFTISPPFVQVTAPNGGERWASGSAHAITWVALGASRVKLEYSVNGGNSWQFINAVEAASGMYSWTVPQVESPECLVRVTDAAVSERTDMGDAVFSIKKPYITVTAPNGGENWTAGQMQTITWESDGVEHITVEYSVDGGLSWNQIAKNIDASSHSYSWWPLGVQTMLGLVRITNSENADISDMSDIVFSIAQILSVSERIPREFSVSPNSPNPFNPSTAISFALPRGERVKVDIYNLSGQRMGTLLDGNLEPGKHTVIWEPKGLSAGVYLGLVRAGTDVKTVKMLFLK